MDANEEDIQRQIAKERRLAKKLEDFDGRWVAIRGDNIVESSDDLQGLTEKIGGRDDVTCFKVFNGPCCFHHTKQTKSTSDSPDIAQIIEKANKTSVTLPTGYFSIPRPLRRLLGVS